MTSNDVAVCNYLVRVHSSVVDCLSNYGNNSLFTLYVIGMNKWLGIALTILNEVAYLHDIYVNISLDPHFI